MARLWPLLLLLLVPILLFPGALPGPRVVSADDHLTVHHLFQSADEGGHVRHPHLSDPALQFKALRKRTVRALTAGQAPLWNPDIYAGAPLLADAQSQPGSPVTWLHVLLPPDIAQDVGVAWILVWTGLGTALLLLALGVSPMAAAVGGAAAMLGPYPMVWLLHPHAATFCWLPWLLWAVETRRGWAAALVVAGMAGGGHPGTLAHGLLVGGAWWAIRARDPRTAAGVVVGLLLAAPLLAPLVELAGRSETASARHAIPLDPRQLLDLAWPGALGHPAAGTWDGTGSWADGQLHPGIGTLALAAVALRWPAGRALVAGWAVMVSLAFVPLPGPVAHGRLGSQGALLLAIAAGVAAHRLSQSRPRWVPAALGAMVISTGIFARNLDQGSLVATEHDPAPAAWVADLRAEVCPANLCGRVLGIGWAAQPNTAALAGLRDLRGYDLPVSTDTRRLMTALRPQPKGPWYPVEELPPVPLLRFLGVRAVVAPPETPVGLDPLPLDDAPVHAFVVPDPAPNAWLAPRPRAATDPRAALAQVAADPDAWERPPVEGWTGGGAAGPARQLHVTWDGASRAHLRLPADANGVAILAQKWAPGWRASIDGRPVPVMRAGGVFAAVAVRPGDQDIDLRYRPDGWILGVRLALLGCGGLLGLAVWARRRG